MRQPWLIQRCNLDENGLHYDYMGSTEFEIGDQAAALKRIFAIGLAIETTIIFIGEKEIRVYMVAAKDFPFSEYQPYLQQLAECKLRLKECTHFDDSVMEAITSSTAISASRTNVWFDFRNDILWTLSGENQGKLVSTLEKIKTLWRLQGMFKGKTIAITHEGNESLKNTEGVCKTIHLTEYGMDIELEDGSRWGFYPENITERFVECSLVPSMIAGRRKIELV